jgi:hypothetical protein
MVSKVGIDPKSVDEVRATLRVYGERFVLRIYIDFQRHECRGELVCGGPA